MAKWKVETNYADGTKRTLETADGAKAMNEASNGAWVEDQRKTVTLYKDDESLWSQKIESWKDKEAKEKKPGMASDD